MAENKTSLLDKILTLKTGVIILVAALILINLVVLNLNSRLDLTPEKRYTLSKYTTSAVRKLSEPVIVEVFLEGEFPAGFQKLANSTRDFLKLLKEKNSGKIIYRFISPKDKIPGKPDIRYGDSLINMGLQPINLTVQLKEGQQQNYIFPAAVVKYGGRQQLVNLYGGSNRFISQNEINEAEALLEYQFISALDKLTKTGRPAIAYATGNGQPQDIRIQDLTTIMQQDYDFYTFNLQQQPFIPPAIQLLLIVKPSIPFTEADKLKIDQFVMRGGKLLCFMDALYAEPDSLAFKSSSIAYDRNLNLTDLFFRYGARINTDLVMDLQCEAIPFIVGEGVNGQPQQEFLPWNYYPLFQSKNDHPINRNLGLVSGRFVNSIDSIQVDDVVKKVLLSSSASSRVIKTPAVISLNENKTAPQDARFNAKDIPVAMLLQGKFTSLYKNRVSKTMNDSLVKYEMPFKPVSDDNKIIIVGDGDMVLNESLPDLGPLVMGWNKFSYRAYEQNQPEGKYFFPVANRQFLQNCVEYLTANPAIIETRNKNIVLRLLDSKKVKSYKSTWQFINFAFPLIILLIAGALYQYIRKRRYSHQ